MVHHLIQSRSLLHSSRRSTPAFRKRYRTSRLNVEQLESRRLLAVDFAFDSMSGALVIDDRSTHVDAITVTSVDHAPAPTVVINGTDTGLYAAEVQSLRIYGGPGDDTIDLTALRRDSFTALTDGTVAVFGGGGNDILRGTELADYLSGGNDDDQLFGSVGDDVLSGNEGVDWVDGEDGHDVISVTQRVNSGLPNVLITETQISGDTLHSLSVSFDQDVWVDPQALRIHAPSGGFVDLSSAAFAFEHATLTATWDLTAADLGAGHYLYDIDAPFVIGVDGDALDGNADGTAADAFFGKVLVGDPGQTTDPHSAPEILAFTTSAGDGNWSQLEFISIQFDSDVGASIDIHDLSLVSANDAFVAAPVNVQYEPAARTATWQFDASQIEPGYYTAQLAGTGVADVLGNPLAGDYQLAGSDFRRTVLVAVPGDLNLDGVVDQAEAAEVIAGVGSTNADWQDGDFDANGQVTPVDAALGIAAIGAMSFDQQGAAPPISSFFETVRGGTGDDRFLFHSPRGDERIRLWDDGGSDTLDFRLIDHGSGLHALDLDAPSFQLVDGPHKQLNLEFHNTHPLENVVGTQYDDVIRGNGEPNVLWAGDGNDVLEARGGDDELYGGRGDDTFVFSGTQLGHDYLGEPHSQGHDTIDLTWLAGEPAFSFRNRTQVVRPGHLTLTVDDLTGDFGSIEAVLPDTFHLVAEDVQASAQGLFHGPVGWFSDSLSGGDPDDYQAVIDWGDGQQTPGDVVPNASGDTFVIMGRHQYATPGVHAVTVSVHRGGTAVAVETSTAEVFNKIIYSSSGVLDNVVIAQLPLEIPSGALYAPVEIQQARPGQNARQWITLPSHVTTGSFALQLYGQTTAAIPWNAAAQELRTAIADAFDEFSQADLIVSDWQTPDVRGWEIEFVGDHAQQPVPLIEGSGSFVSPVTVRVTQSDSINVLDGHLLAGTGTPGDGPIFNCFCGGNDDPGNTHTVDPDEPADVRVVVNLITFDPEPTAGTFELAISTEGEASPTIWLDPFAQDVPADDVAVAINDHILLLGADPDDSGSLSVYWQDLPNNHSAGNELLISTVHLLSDTTSFYTPVFVDAQNVDLLATSSAVDSEVTQAGTAPVNEIQQIRLLPSYTEDSFTLRFGSQAVVLSVDATVTEMTSALESMAGAGNVLVTKPADRRWLVEFVGDLAATDLPPLSDGHSVSPSAIIHWDPATATPGTTAPAGPYWAGVPYDFQVRGTHSYGSPGAYPVSVATSVLASPLTSLVVVGAGQGKRRGAHVRPPGPGHLHARAAAAVATGGGDGPGRHGAHDVGAGFGRT